MAEKVLKEVRSNLIEDLTVANINQLLDKLNKEDPNQPPVLNKQEVEYILEQYPSRADKVRVLIDSVIKKGTDASSILIEELKRLDPLLYNKLKLDSESEKIQKNSREAEKTSHDPEVAVGTHTDEGHGDEEYPMNSKPRGYCLIINNYNFKEKALLWGLIPGRTTTRDGTNKDAGDLEEVFTLLGFKVEKYQDLTAKDMKELIKNFKKDKTDYGDCFVCCVLSHGENNAVCGTDWKICPISDIISPFDGKNCPSLAGKPKVFFIQACRGNMRQEKVTVTADNADKVESYTIPKDSDFLIAMSTVEGCVSYRRKDREGSWFVQSLCPLLKEGSRRGDDILSILTKVNKEVSRMEGIEVRTVKGKEEEVDAKMTPEPRYTLTKKLIFRIPP